MCEKSHPNMWKKVQQTSAFFIKLIGAFIVYVTFLFSSNIKLLLRFVLNIYVKNSL